MILTASRVFLGSQNFSYTSLERNRELGLITSNPIDSRFVAPHLRLRLRGRAPVHRPVSLLRRLVVGQRRSQPEFRRRAVQREHVLLEPLRRLRRVRALKPARTDRDRHRRRRTLGQLSHRLKRLRRRLLPRSGQRGRRDGHGTRRARHLPREAEPVMRANLANRSAAGSGPSADLLRQLTVIPFRTAISTPVAWKHVVHSRRRPCLHR